MLGSDCIGRICAVAPVCARVYVCVHVHRWSSRLATGCAELRAATPRPCIRPCTLAPPTCFPACRTVPQWGQRAMPPAALFSASPGLSQGNRDLGALSLDAQHLSPGPASFEVRVSEGGPCRHTSAWTFCPRVHGHLCVEPGHGAQCPHSGGHPHPDAGCSHCMENRRTEGQSPLRPCAAPVRDGPKCSVHSSIQRATRGSRLASDQMGLVSVSSRIVWLRRRGTG